MSAAIPAKFRKNNKPTKNVQLFDFLAVSLTPDKKSKGAKISTAKNIPKEPSTGGSKREIASKKDVPQGNLLDKSGPQLHKGKTRPNKKKRDTRTKKVFFIPDPLCFSSGVLYVYFEIHGKFSLLSHSYVREVKISEGVIYTIYTRTKCPGVRMYIENKLHRKWGGGVKPTQHHPPARMIRFDFDLVDQRR